MTSSENQPLPFAIRVDTGFQTHVGKKKPNNEDYVAFFEPSNQTDLEYSGCLYIVADGVGGAKRGEKASEYAAEKVIYEYYQQPEELPGERLRNILRNVGNEILDYSGRAGLGKMATTLVAAVIRGDRLLVANVGDSRAYLIRNDNVDLLTRDHNQLSELLRSGALTDEEGRRSKAGNILTRSIGGHEDVDVDVFPELRLQPGDLIIMCSDGLHRYLDDENLLAMTQSGTADDIAMRLVKYANQSGGADNISALIISICPQEGAQLHSHSTARLEKPQPLDQMPTEVKFFRGCQRRKFVFRSEYLLFAAPILMILLVVGLFGNRIVNLLKGAPAPTQAPTITIIEGTPLSTPGSIETLPVSIPTVIGQMAPSVTPMVDATIALAVEDINMPTPEQMATGDPVDGGGQIPPQLTETTAPGYCVHKAIPGSGITHILGLYGPNGVIYDPGKTYTYYRNCDLSTRICTNPVHLLPDQHDLIDPTDYLWVEEIKDGQTCEAKEGIWVVAVE